MDSTWAEGPLATSYWSSSGICYRARTYEICAAYIQVRTVVYFCTGQELMFKQYGFSDPLMHVSVPAEIFMVGKKLVLKPLLPTNRIAPVWCMSVPTPLQRISTFNRNITSYKNLRDKLMVENMHCFYNCWITICERCSTLFYWRLDIRTSPLFHILYFTSVNKLILIYTIIVFIH